MTLTAPQQALGYKSKEHDEERLIERSPLSDKMIRLVLLHFAGLDASTLRDYTFERYKADYPNAIAALDIFDSTGKSVFQGQELRSGIAGYWRPSRASSGPKRSSTDQDWGTSAHRASSGRFSRDLGMTARE
jgi:hypothetical protein